MHHRILCVDDEPAALRALTRSLLRLEGVDVDAAASARAARELCAKHRYSLIVTDHAMPGETGVEMLESLARAGCEAVPLVVTGERDVDVALQAVNRGHVHGLIHKPWHEGELLLAARRALERFELADQLRRKVAELEEANAALRARNKALEAAKSEIRHLSEVAATDDKTGARTHRFFSDRLEEEVARARRYRRPLALMLVDLDGFKAVNDEHGHVAGDVVLRGVAGVLKSSIRVMDVLARYGGDEFAVILPDTASEGAVCLAERLCLRVRHTALEPIGPGRVTLSLGVASLPEQPAESGKDLLSAADSALYQAKAAGKDRVMLAQATA